MDLAQQFNHKADRNIYNTLVMLGYLLHIISPGTSWIGRIKKLFDEYVADKVALMGFPENWRDLPLWGEGK